VFFPELSYVSLEELEGIYAGGIFKVERDLYLETKYSISIYAEAARMLQAITEDETVP
jgi:hypothetical protein